MASPEVSANDKDLTSLTFWARYSVVDTVRLQGMDGRVITLKLPTGERPHRMSCLEENCATMGAVNVSAVPFSGPIRGH